MFANRMTWTKLLLSEDGETLKKHCDSDQWVVFFTQGYRRPSLFVCLFFEKRLF